MTEAKPETLAGDEAPSAALMLKWIGIVLGLAALCVVVVGLLLPREWHVEASVDIDAPLEDIIKVGGTHVVTYPDRQHAYA